MDIEAIILSMVRTATSRELDFIFRAYENERKSRMRIRIEDGEFPIPSKEELMECSKRGSVIRSILEYKKRHDVGLHIAKDVMEYYRDAPDSLIAQAMTVAE
jgi:hypothetical protein